MENAGGRGRPRLWKTYFIGAENKTASWLFLVKGPQLLFFRRGFSVGIASIMEWYQNYLIGGTIIC
jgi:hypothetical protein